jgi:hypothetical protein
MRIANAGKPVTSQVLAILAAAGEAGILAGDIARQFAYPEDLSRRNVKVNNILRTLASSGRVRKADREERSPHYRNTPVYRWWITEDGLRYLANGLRPDQAVQMESDMARRADDRRRHAKLIKAAKREHGKGEPDHVRERVIKELRAEGCTWIAIGTVYGISRERARQIHDGLNVNPCLCDACVPPDPEIMALLSDLMHSEAAMHARRYSHPGPHGPHRRPA